MIFPKDQTASWALTLVDKSDGLVSYNLFLFSNLNHPEDVNSNRNWIQQTTSWHSVCHHSFLHHSSQFSLRKEKRIEWNTLFEQIHCFVWLRSSFRLAQVSSLVIQSSNEYDSVSDPPYLSDAFWVVGILRKVVEDSTIIFPRQLQSVIFRDLSFAVVLFKRFFPKQREGNEGTTCESFEPFF